MNQPDALPQTGAVCDRCQRPLRLNPKPGSKATMLKRAATPKGYCIKCAAHDFIRHTYPMNFLVESNPQKLLVPHIQEQFGAIMEAGFSDAQLDEIDWQWLVDHWNLPFDKPTMRTNTNPCDDDDIRREAAVWKQPRFAPRTDPLGGKLTINSFEELNLLEPGLGDDLKNALDKQLNRETPTVPSESPESHADQPKPQQQTFSWE